MRLISIQETESVGGGMGPIGAVVGGALGAVGYMSTVIITGQGNGRDLLAAVGGGAVAGFISPVTVAGTALAAIGVFYGGLVTGAIIVGGSSSGPLKKPMKVNEE
jgi:hypothetical protein